MNSLLILLCLCGFLLIGCQEIHKSDSLFYAFQHPTSEAKPMVRWWWNGNAVDSNEIKRELKVMEKAGIGGVEINSIAMPNHAKKTDAIPLQWAGAKWCNMVNIASREAQMLGMITDLIVGSGWPFGGRFLKEEETIQRMNIKSMSVKAGTLIKLDIADFLSSSSPNRGTLGSVELVSANLIPENIESIEQVINITSRVENNWLDYQLENRNYTLVIVYKEQNYQSVSVGSPGADGPIMDHFKVESVRGYLNRLRVIEKETGLTLSELIRALFCDSIELSGSNWTDDMHELFLSRNGYEISPWLPFILQSYGKPDKYEASAPFSDSIKRVRYDFYNTIISVFLERFTTEFQKFCTENGVLCRYQAYGYPFYMGIFQGNMIPDIPESNNWIYSRGRNEAENPEYTWVQNHGYMLWNKAASSAANLTGKSIVSSEAMTNTGGVFRTSLETLKQSDDVNFITGINHSVLHGYNYSPPEAGFPGWMRFGAYFSEQNTWWSYFKHWASYNARLSSVFQNSKPESQIAVLGRLRDWWGEVGLARSYVNDEPWYYARLWEPISNLGSSCDYIHQPVLETAIVDGKNLLCGNMSYHTIWLTEVESLSPVAAHKLLDFAKSGGSVVFIGEAPHRSLSLQDAQNNDRLVKDAIAEMIEYQNVVTTTGPQKSDDFIEWTGQLLQQSKIDPPIRLSAPVSYLYTMKKTIKEREIFFFANTHRKHPVEVEVHFANQVKYPTIWDPETGERFAYPYTGNNRLKISLDALESALIVLEPNDLDLPQFRLNSLAPHTTKLNTTWDVKFEHVNSTVFTLRMDTLIDFKNHEDEAVRTFSGTVSYSTTVEGLAGSNSIRLDNVNQAVTELFVNGKSAGIKWYGNHLYDVSKLVKPGNNHLEIRLTTTLANYCMSLKDNPAAMAWAGRYKQPFSSGLIGINLIK